MQLVKFSEKRTCLLPVAGLSVTIPYQPPDGFLIVLGIPVQPLLMVRLDQERRTQSLDLW